MIHCTVYNIFLQAITILENSSQQSEPLVQTGISFLIPVAFACLVKLFFIRTMFHSETYVKSQAASRILLHQLWPCHLPPWRWKQGPLWHLSAFFWNSWQDSARIEFIRSLTKKKLLWSIQYITGTQHVIILLQEITWVHTQHSQLFKACHWINLYDLQLHNPFTPKSDQFQISPATTPEILTVHSGTVDPTYQLTLSLPSSKSTFCHLSKLWKAKFFIPCDVIFLVRLQEKFESDHCWEWKV